MDDKPADKTIERTVLLVLLALVLFASPAMFAWARDDSPWYTPYILWFVVIAGAAWINWRRRDV